MDPERTGVPPENPASTGEEGDGGIRDDGLPRKVKLLAYLHRAGANISEVARQVGKERNVIYRLMEQYGIKGEGRIRNKAPFKELAVLPWGPPLPE
jgi:hypothetical protein